MKEETEQNRTVVAKKNMIEALKKKLGVVKTACEEVGISRSTFYYWLDEDPEFKEAVENIDEEVKDFAEASLYTQIRSGSVRATTFYLERQAKDRGYGKESTVNVRGSIDFNSEPKALETLLKTYALVASKQKE